MSRAVGDAFEKLAADYLSQHGFRVLSANYTCKGGEIDLVCDDHGTLVFVEVRARARGRYGTPAETISALKRKRLVHAARHYLATQHGDDEPACRFDVVAIEGSTLTHLRDAFEVE
ncbi:MAG: YraN family protein [Polyangia bacterium]